MKALNLLGQKFGMLLVVATDHSDSKRRRWLCRCDCTVERVLTTGELRSGDVTSCGCNYAKQRQSASLRHGNNRFGRRTKEYRTWAHIIGRCTNPDDKAWPDYGGRGISVCSHWTEFENFLADMGQAPSAAHSIDRIDNDGNYEPSNCRWATKSMQSRNTRRTIKIDGMCLKDACNERGLSYEAVQMRLRRGDPLELALSPLIGRAYRAMLAASDREERRPPPKEKP